jgi:hypothetical protein
MVQAERQGPSIMTDCSVQSLFPGNGILPHRRLKARNGRQSRFGRLPESKQSRQCPPIRAYSQEIQEICVNARLRGGPGRTRTSNQTVMSGRL